VSTRRTTTCSALCPEWADLHIATNHSEYFNHSDKKYEHIVKLKNIIQFL
jgi:hypothetical protein